MTEATIWSREHRPVLAAVVNALDQSEHAVTLRDIMQATRFDASTTFRAVRALEQGGFVEWVPSSPPESSRIKSANGDARRAVQTWPSAESIADRLLAALSDVAEHGDDEVTRSRARKALDGIGSLTRDTLVSVAGAAAGVAMQ